MQCGFVGLGHEVDLVLPPVKIFFQVMYCTDKNFERGKSPFLFLYVEKCKSR